MIEEKERGINFMAKKKTGQNRYAIYVRCSSDDQAHKDFSTTDVQAVLDKDYVLEHGGVLETV